MINVPNILPKDNEINYLRESFFEAAMQRGHPVEVFLVNTSETDIQNDKEYTYDEPFEVYVLFEEYPKRSVLSQLGWLNETGENQPVAYLPTFYYVNGTKVPLRPVRGTKLRIPYDTFDGSYDDFREFQVSDLAADSSRVLNWIVRLVPVRNKDSFAPNDSPGEEDDDYRYLNITRERNE